jgi:sterol desaturase/sphingolipid hydroxylase (fatty acid hydroxylase superfamily)
VAIWESVEPLRRFSASPARRWGSHALLFAVAALLQTVFVRLIPVGVASYLQHYRFGLLNQGNLPFALQCLLTIVLLDLLQYWTHRIFHSYFALWRVHEVHHSDPDYDVSTSARFHPLEVLLPQFIRILAVVVLGSPALAVLIDQAIGMIFNFAEHANAAFPPKVETLVRKVFITPDLHRIHHSQERAEQSSNFGQTFSFWDRAFGTFRPQPNTWPVVTGVKSPYAPATTIRGLLTAPFEARKWK